jgi:hypothetical protein
VVYTVTNEGDYQTTASILLLIPIAAGLELAAIAATGWTVAYSTDGVAFGAAPDLLSDTTHVRLTRVAALAVNASATATITYTPMAEGESTLLASVTTMFESDASNNSDTLIVEIAV